MAKAVTANPDITQLPDALTLPTRELIEYLLPPLREGLVLYQKQAAEQNRDALEARTVLRAERFLNQLERALPEVGE